MKFTYSPLNSVVVGIAVILSAATLSPMIDQPVSWSAVLVLVVPAAAIGALGAVLGGPRIVTIMVQLIAMLAALVFIGLSMQPDAEATWLARLISLGREGIFTIQTNPAPLPLDNGTLFLSLLALALVMLIIELLVNGLEQPAWSIAPIGVIYGISAIALTDEVSPAYFLLVVLAYGAILLVATGFHSHRASGFSERAGFSISRLGASVLALLLATGVTLAVTPNVPMGDKRPWLSADSARPIELSDPTVSLSENLLRPEEQQVLRYTTNTGEPVYLRTVALTQLTTEGAVLTPMQLSTGGLSGAYDFPGDQVDVDIEMDFGSEYLPVPFAVERFSAAGQWAYDRSTMSIISTGEGQTTQTEELSYSVRSVVPRPEQEILEQVEAGRDPSGDETLQVPSGLDPQVAQLTGQITEGTETAGAAAIAIQRFLRSSEFSYSLNAPQSTSLDTLSTFLLEDQAGYCIHFAASMVAMARIEGIPARMAIGFTPGTADDDGYVVTTHNMHAWPELYFEELGWIPFEPTPSVGSPPEWTDPDSDEPVPPTPEPSPEPTATDTAEPQPPTIPEEPTAEPSPTETPDDGMQGEGGITNPWPWVLLVSVVALALLPAGARWALGAWRLRAGQPSSEAAENAWRETRAILLDARLEWPEGSPVRLSTHAGRSLSPQGAEILAAIAHTVERARYARGETDTSALAGQVRALRVAINKQLPGREFPARFLPASLLPNRSR